MTIIDVVGTVIVFVVAAVVIVSNVVIARSEYRTNLELLRVQREWIEKMKGKQMGDSDEYNRLNYMHDDLY